MPCGPRTVQPVLLVLCWSCFVHVRGWTLGSSFLQVQSVLGKGAVAFLNRESSDGSQDAEADVDVVVERYCEDLGWLNNLSAQVRPHTHVLVYDKSNGDCPLADAGDFPTDLHVTVRPLKNVGRDGHDQLYHITEHYDSLAPFTAFVQAGFHWTLRGLPDKNASGWSTQAEALNDLLTGLLENKGPRFLPLTMYTRRGPVLWQDREDDTDPDLAPEVNVLKFATGWSDMYQKAREGYSLLFGGTPCEARGQRFTAGMQYIVARENIRFRPLSFWRRLREDIVACDPALGYVFERLTTAVYNSTVVAKENSSMLGGTFCQQGLNWSSFTSPLRPFESAKFWREHWGCEPLSKRLLDMRTQGEI